MQLDRMLARCRGLEERAAALYRRYAAASRNEPAACALWTALARDEEAHARSLVGAAFHREATNGWRTRLDGWEESIREVERRLGEAERLAPVASPEEQIAAALALEMSELDTMRHALLVAADVSAAGTESEAHVERLLEAAARHPDAPQLGLLVALLRARAHLKVAS